MYYDSIEAAIAAAPNCTHVLTRTTTGGHTDFVPVKSSAHAGRFIGFEDPVQLEYDIERTPWVVAHRNYTERPLGRTEQPAPAALDTQVGGDHYKSLKIQPVEYITENNIPYLEGNVIKYVTRHASKNGVQDIDKAIHYLELIKQFHYPEPTEHRGATLISWAERYISIQPRATWFDYKVFMKQQGKSYVSEWLYNSMKQAIADGACNLEESVAAALSGADSVLKHVTEQYNDK